MHDLRRWRQEKVTHAQCASPSYAPYGSQDTQEKPHTKAGSVTCSLSSIGAQMIRLANAAHAMN